ncbi:MAG TPA: GNAT family N-acetyltransferase [Bryobacteraceae bacterium]|nr:GNAT family N-acetyltransferase [Bryobacteraceae bacterium]
MAAVSDLPLARIVELRQLRSGNLDALLAEETEVWNENLDWDFRASANLVRRFLDMQALNGYALLANTHPIGYCYYVSEEKKGLIGDLYVMRNFVTAENEARLLSAVVDTLMKTAYIQRIESQLMMLRNASRLALPQRGNLHVYPRTFMQIELRQAARLPEGRASHPVLIDNWSERRQDDAASLIASAYQGHIDAEINDQYRSPAGARRFLTNIIQYPGCGSFFQPASFVALDQSSGKVCGICLSSLVHSDVGHITQVCVSKSVRGCGVGYDLIRRSLQSLARHGCRKASLTVTSSNSEAIALYERMGFRHSREFTAYVWSNFSPRA